MLYNGHCYYIVEADLNWADAQVCSYHNVSWQSVLFSFCLLGKKEYPEKTTDFPQVIDKVDLLAFVCLSSIYVFWLTNLYLQVFLKLERLIWQNIWSMFSWQNSLNLNNI